MLDITQRIDNTGIMGNEFFARDLNLGVPDRFNATTPGVISLSSGAFRGYDGFGKRDLFKNDFFVPYQFDWKEPVDPFGTPQNRTDVLRPETVTFSGEEGVSEGGGIYNGAHTLDAVPALNTVNIDGAASVDVRRSQNTCSSCSIVSSSVTLESSASMEVYGVDMKVQTPPVVLVDENGHAEQDYAISYAIEPPEYRAMSAEVLIYKDQEVVVSIPSERGGQGSATVGRGFWFDVNAPYYAEVVLNRGTGVEMKSERAPLDVVQLYIEKEDPEYPEVKLRWDDYYPALGGKIITLKTGQQSLEGARVSCAVTQATAEALGIVGPAVTAECTPLDSIDAISDGTVKMLLTAEGIAPRYDDDVTTGLDNIELGFALTKGEKEFKDIIHAAYRVKNNYNTTLGEVLNGEAVFVHDESYEDNHVGRTTGNVGDEEKKFDFVQELLNQVAPRKRSVSGYSLIEEGGVFGKQTATAIGTFKENFGIASNTSPGNASNIFRKLMKDYGLGGQESAWLNKIVGRELLVGQTKSADDRLVNGAAGNERNDTGLYELYAYVVRPFVEAMIAEAERYAGLNGGTVPTDNWVARSGHGPAGTSSPGEHGPGMSYSFGGRASVDGFNKNVANCQAYDTAGVAALEAGSNKYRGNVNEATCAVEPGQTKRWAGLLQNEWNDWYYWQKNGNDGSNHPFAPSYWAGIDCSGLVYRVVDSARDDKVNVDLGTVDNYYTGNAFENNKVYKMDVPSDEDERIILYGKLGKGDLVEYKGHMSIVYSDRPTCATTDCTYEIIHAYGGDKYQPIDNYGKKVGNPIFSRKVIKTKQNISATPEGFGRIKLWE